jgi:hypothetical protein
MRRLKILYSSTVSENLVRLGSLAKAIGITAEYAPVAHASSLARTVEEIDQDTHIVLDAGSLSGVCKKHELDRIVAILRSREITVLLLATTAGKGASQFLEALTGGALQGIDSVNESDNVSFPDTTGKATGELASYSYPRGHGAALVLVARVEMGVEILMKLDGSPAFVRVPVGRATVFAWSTLRIFDVERPLTAEREFEEAPDEYIPAIIFLRLVFGQQCWHNPCNGAGMVIDDPLLRNNYGFISFRQLLESGRKHGYHITLAFIPWNYWRTHASDAKIFLNYSDCFSVCAHGCDHTNREFRSTDYESLLNKNFIARQRMERLRQRTGMPNEPLMVCPQEQYSLEAMRAFADSRQFIGLVCTACMPRNLTSPQLRGADLLLPAQDSFFGFPVFKRHYWRGMSVFAMALFLGKPAILVEHHEFFRKGPAGVDAFVSALSKLQPNMKWTSLVETVTRTHLRRRVSEGKYELRFFTDKFKLEHESAAPAEYRFIRRIPADTLVSRVTVNGGETPFIREDGLLSFEVRSDQPQTIHVELEIPPVRPAYVRSSGIKYQASVALRRGLSELRDNVIARNDFALRASKRLAKTLKQTGG